ncbi:type III-B CRISPR module-associated protein Cmr5 [Oceanithermus sp.]
MTREQKRASLVYERVKRYEKKDEGSRKDYGGMALRFPALLRSAGLVQALAFVDARGKDAHKDFIRDFASILAELDGEAKTGETAFKDYFAEAREAGLPGYMRMTREALAVADWFKRFAQSVLKVEPGEE